MIKVTDTVSLELVEEKHAEAIFDLVCSNKHLLWEWLPWVDGADLNFIKNFVAESKKQYDAKTDYAFVILNNNKVIGRIGIYDITSKTGSVGYWLDENFQGKGIITQSCVAIINYAFNNLHLNKIEIKCGTENRKSQRIPERLNFKKEKTIPQGEILNNKLIDLYLYSMTSSYWKLPTIKGL